MQKCKGERARASNSSFISSQSAMEYLMTYGWAILIIAIVLVALFSLGVFNSANFSPRAQPGSCEVFRTSAQTSLGGQCNGMLPEYVAQFNGLGGDNGTSTGNINPNTYGESYINLPKNILGSGSITKLTYTAWIKTDWSDGGNGIIGIGTAGFQTGYCGTLCLHQCNSGDSGVSISTPLNNNQYYFVAVTLNSSSTANTLTFYIDNESAITTTAELPSVGGYANIGSIACFGYYFNGNIANIQLYNASLSGSEVQALYKEGIGGAPIDLQNLVGWRPLNGNANDYSGYGNDGTATNVTYTSAWTSGYSAP